MGETKGVPLRADFNRRPKLEFHGSKITSDAGLLPEVVEHWFRTTLQTKLIRFGAKVVRHGRYVTFQIAEVGIPRRLFAEILRLIDGLLQKPAPT
jgi:hypothetical protein